VRDAKLAEQRLAIIGLDCATWRLITPYDDRLPTFRALANKHFSSTLISDVCRTHSAPVWTTFFSGIRAVEHRILDWTIDGSYDSRLWTRNDIPVRFFWEYYQEKTSYALAIPCVFPVLYYGIPHPGKYMGLPETSDLKAEDVKRENNTLTRQVLECFKNPDVQFVAAVYRSLDTACHLMNTEARLEIYEHVDKTLREWIMPALEGWNWIILSDHGCENLDRTDNDVKLPPDKFYGNHHRDGILITNRPDLFKAYSVYELSRKVLNFVRRQTHERRMHPKHRE
jgi:hypothetical protein